MRTNLNSTTALMYLYTSIVLMLGATYAVAQPTTVLKVVNCQAVYHLGAPVLITVKNTSGSSKIAAVITLQVNLAGTWVDQMPYLGANKVTKAVKIETLKASEAKQFTLNAKDTPELYRLKVGRYRVVFMPFDERTKKTGAAVELHAFEIIE